MRRNWTKAEQAAVRHYRRARIAGSDTDYKAEQWERLCVAFGGACLCCGASRVAVDHVVPLSVGGTNTLDNLQPLCKRCNSRKGQRVIDYRDPRVLVQVLEEIS